MSDNMWADRWRDMQDGYDPDEDRMLEYEAQSAEDMGTYPCDVDNCNGTAYYRPAVGGWWCTTCGELVMK